MSKKWLGTLIGIWIVAIVLGVIYSNTVKDKSIKKINTDEITIEEKVKEKVTIYIPGADGRELIKKDENIEESQSRRDKSVKVVSKTIEVLQNEGFLENKDITVLNLYFSGDTAYIDLSPSSKEMDDNSRKSLLNIYSIVNSLTELGNINRVKILINGKDGSNNLSKFYNQKRVPQKIKGTLFLVENLKFYMFISFFSFYVSFRTKP